MCSGGLEDEPLIGLQLILAPLFLGHNTPGGQDGEKSGLAG